jgi:hypothetical protein
MILRVLLAAPLLLTAPVRAETAAEKAGFSPKLAIYLARGPANSCGPGCDRWIAIEGEVDVGAAARIRLFLSAAKDTQRPIYFHSPGGAVEPSFAIGRLLRNRKAVARVGRTIVNACAAGTQIDAACLKIKNGGGEVEAELRTRNAMCNSACGYLFLGATTREVAPDAVIAVHNSKLTLIVHGHPPPQMVAGFRERRLAVADRERTAFIASMGIKGELNDLIKTVKFESLHVLTRAELYRFGIDPRPSLETAWTFEPESRPYIRKIAAARQGDSATFRTMEWRLSCENKDRARLMFVREFDPGAGGLKTMILTADPDKSIAFGKIPARVGKYEMWSDVVAPDAMQVMLAASSLHMGEGTLDVEGKTKLATFDIDTLGLGASWTRLLSSCPATTRPAATSSTAPGAPAIPAISADPATAPK